jgi:hypothetical protein
MRYLRAFGRFWYDFIVGDDWRVAAGLAVALAATWALVRAGLNPWWLMPLAVGGLLWMSLALATRRTRGG